MSDTARPYTDPYLAGIGIGVVLLLSFVLVGRGLGASGAFTAVVETGVRPALLSDWLVVEILGVFIGGFASAFFARRLRLHAERGIGTSSSARIALAFAGGATMGVGAKLARGCTSGLGLTGGALLSVGSWIFVMSAFAAAYAAAPLLRRTWR